MRHNFGILLGAGISYSGELPYDAKTRVKKAYKLLKRDKIQKLILSGGFTSSKFPKISEAKLYEIFLTSKGIPKKNLIMEENSLDTLGNAIFSKKLILKNNLTKDGRKEIALITSSFHMKRSLFVFQYIFGDSFTFTPFRSFPLSTGTLIRKFKEFKKFEATRLFFTNIQKGDHLKSEKLLKTILPLYHSKAGKR